MILYMILGCIYIGNIQAGTNCGRLAGGLRGPSEFLRTKRSARVFSVGLRLSSFPSPQSSVLSHQSSVISPQYVAFCWHDQEC